MAEGRPLWRCLSERQSVQQLRATWTPADIRLLGTRSISNILFHAGLHEDEDYDTHSQWMLSVMTWLLDECGLPANAVVWQRSREQIVDFICDLHGLFPVVDLLNLVCARGGKPAKGWDACLRACAERRHFLGSLCRRLIDAGATPSLLRGDATETTHQMVRMWYETRCACRAACVAFMSMRRKAPPLFRRCAPVDILRKIARDLWERRFEVRPGDSAARQRRRRTVKQ